MRLNWRTLLPVLGGLLLPVPLILAMATGVFNPTKVLSASEVPISPMLTAEQRQPLQSYHRECSRQADCEPPLGCLSDTRVHRDYCTDSECETDAQCPAGFACRPLATMERGPQVRYCIPPGVRKEGEGCISIPRDQDYACEAGLLCSEDWCGRPCRTSDPSSCPDGFFCADTTPGPACRPTCEGRECPEGQQCIRDREGASACAVVHGPNCQNEPCPEGGKCLTVFGSRRAGEVWMRCFPECGDGLPSCPEGFICHRTSCQKPCDPEGPNVCDPGFRCLRYTDKQPWLCRPDM